MLLVLLMASARTAYDDGADTVAIAVAAVAAAFSTTFLSSPSALLNNPNLVVVVWPSLLTQQFIVSKLR